MAHAVPNEAWLGKASWFAGAAAAILLAIASLRYIPGFGPLPPKIVANAFALPWLPIHVVASATALLVGSFQFLGGLRGRRPYVHRWAGRIYVAGCMVGGVSGLVLAFGTTMGQVTTAGFGILAPIWLVVTGLGWQRARQGRYVEHRRWMIRSWALTFAAVNLRLYLGIAFALGIPFEQSYPLISFLCWVPNLILAEICLRGALQRGWGGIRTLASVAWVGGEGAAIRSGWR